MQGGGGNSTESLGAPAPAPVWLQGNVVALVHDSGDSEDEENDLLLSGLSHQSHLILRAEGLATGFCRDVHGQVRGGGCSLRWQGSGMQAPVKTWRIPLAPL